MMKYLPIQMRKDYPYFLVTGQYPFLEKSGVFNAIFLFWNRGRLEREICYLIKISFHITAVQNNLN